MKNILIIPFILFSLATVTSWSNANDAKIAQSHELSKHRRADQNTLKHAHNHDRKQKSKYDLRDLGRNQNEDNHGRGHKHGHKDGHEHGDAHQSHEDGHGSHDDHSHEGHGKGHEHGYDRLWGIGVSG